jgi:DNA-binding MarR family transcriptional regulator
MDNLTMADTPDDAIEPILDLDSLLQQLLRDRWPAAWLQIQLPLGSTRALLAIEGRNARTPGRVAEVLGVSRTTVTGLLDRLEGEGLVTRSVDPDDRRCFLLQLTAKGHDLIGQIEGERRAHLAAALAALAPEDRRALHTGLAALVTTMQAHPAPQSKEKEGARGLTAATR